MKVVGSPLTKAGLVWLALFAGACDAQENSGPAPGGPGGGKADTPDSAADFCLELECADLVNISMGQDLLHEDFIRWPAGDRDGVTGPQIIDESEGGESFDCGALTEKIRQADFDSAVACVNGPCAFVTTEGESAVELWNGGSPDDLQKIVCEPTGSGSGSSRLRAQGRDDRGQEYNEYFAILDLDLIGEDPSGEAKPLVLGRTTGGNADQYWLDPQTDLDEDQRDWLDDEDNEDEVIGSCIFTGWHWDIEEPPRNADVGDIHGVEVSYDNFRMHGRFNNNFAAFALVRDGLTKVADGVQRLREEAEATGQDDLASLHAAYATCLSTGDTGAGVPWRFSDGHSVTTPTAIMSDCGCVAQVGDDTITDPETIARIVIPEKGEMAYDSPILEGGFLRGFPIGTWSSPTELPQGCEYVPVDNEDPKLDSRVLVRCDITAGELASSGDGSLTAAQLDVKEHCRTRDRLGFNVVVHIPLPGDNIVCNPDEGAPAHCFESDGSPRKTPWDGDGLDDTVRVTEGDLELRRANNQFCQAGIQAEADADSRAGNGIRRRADG